MFTASHISMSLSVAFLHRLHCDFVFTVELCDAVHVTWKQFWTRILLIYCWRCGGALLLCCLL